MLGQISVPKAIGLTTIILLLVLAATSIRRWGTSETLSLSVSLLLLACLAILLSKPPARWFWLGFGLFGTAYLAISIASPWGAYLPTSSFLDQLHEWSSPHPQWRDIDDFGESRRAARSEKDSFRRAGHSFVSLLVGLMGGTLVLLCAPSRRENHQLDPPDGSLLKEGWQDQVRP